MEAPPPALAAALPGRRHLLLDRPGFGLSALADVGQGASFRARAVEMLIATLDGLELDRVDVIGNSIGGGMAIWLALAAPSRVRALALAGGVAMIGDAPVPLPLRLLAAPLLGDVMMKLEPPSEEQTRTLWRRYGHDPERLHPSLVEVLLEGQRVPSFGPAWLQVLRATISLAGQRPGLHVPTDALAPLPCPMAFAWGVHDPLVDVAVGRAVAASLGVPFTVAGTGHVPWVDDAEAVARALEPVLAPR